MKNLNELTKEELIKVYKCNDKLQEAVLDEYMDTEMFWIGEMLDYLKHSLSSWSIGFSNRNQHLKIKSGYENRFIEGLKKLQKDMCFFSDKNAHYIEDAENGKMRVEDLRREVLYQFDKFVEFPSNDDLESYFLDMWDRFEDCYVDDDYTMFETIVKSYK